MSTPEIEVEQIPVAAGHVYPRSPVRLPRLSREAGRAWRHAFTWWALTRPTMLLVGYLAILVIGYGPADSVTSQRVSESDLINLPARWDSFFYREIAVSGYSWNGSNEDGQNVAYFPGLPIAMRAISWATGLPALWAGVAFSMAAFLIALVYLYRLTRDLFGDTTARWTTLLLATYPGAVFFSAAYTESLFLLCALGAVHHLRRNEIAAASAWSFVAGLTRVQGFLLCMPLAAIVWKHRHALVGSTRAGWIRASAPLVAPLLGVVLFSAHLGQVTGRPLVWLENQVGWGQPFYADVLQGRLPEHVESTHPITVTDRVLEAGNYVATAFVLGMIPFVSRWLGLEYLLLLAVCVGPPLIGHPVTGMTRYTAVVFPAFIALALALRVPKRVYAVSALFFAAQLFGAAMFFTWRHFF